MSDKLASVGTREESEPSLGDVLKGGGNDGLVSITNLDLARDSSLAELLDHLGPTGTGVEDDQTLDGEAVGNDLEPVLESRRVAVVVL